jgi:hypothetical protein
MKAGVYSVSASSIWAGDRSLQTGSIEPRDFRILPDAENSLLIRSSGELNYEYSTFIGPTFDNTLELSFQDPKYYLTPRQQLWKVGETFQPLDFYELRVKSLVLEISSATPSTCTTDGKILKLIAVGGCSFTVFTSKTKDFAKKISERSVIISAARIKPTLVLQEIKNQSVVDLDKAIEIPNVYAPGVGFVLPVSNTPTVCYATGYFIKLTSSGTCTLRYQTNADDSYLASDVYTQTFEIIDVNKPVVVPTPVATPTPTATPTATPKPVVKKTISCVKGTKTIKKTAISPKCPAGYKVKK